MYSERVGPYDDEVNCPSCNANLRFVPYGLRDEIRDVMYNDGSPTYFHDEYKGLFEAHCLRTERFLDFLQRDDSVPEEVREEVKEAVESWRWAPEGLREATEALLKDVPPEKREWTGTGEEV